MNHLFHDSKFISYGDSKLTLVLRDAFRLPSACVALIVNVHVTFGGDTLLLVLRQEREWHHCRPNR